MVLVNAIYFKGNWEKRFLEKDTSEMPFRLSKVNSFKMSIMAEQESSKYFTCISHPSTTLLTAVADGINSENSNSENKSAVSFIQMHEIRIFS